MDLLQTISIIAKIHNLHQQAIVQPSNLVQQAGQLANKLSKEKIIETTNEETYNALKKTHVELKARIAAINPKAAESIPNFE
jgi:uncharacterized protein involved in exopolysaccharide biosynthesis